MCSNHLEVYGPILLNEDRWKLLKQEKREAKWLEKQSSSDIEKVIMDMERSSGDVKNNITAERQKLDLLATKFNHYKRAEYPPCEKGNVIRAVLYQACSFRVWIKRTQLEQEILLISRLWLWKKFSQVNDISVSCVVIDLHVTNCQGHSTTAWRLNFG